MRSPITFALVLVLAASAVVNCSSSVSKKQTSSEDAGQPGAGSDESGAGGAGDASDGAGGSFPTAGGPSGGALGGGEGGTPGGGEAGAAGQAGAPACCNAAYNASSGLLPNDSCPAWTLIDTAVKDPQLFADRVRVSTDLTSENMYYTHDAPNLTVPATLLIEARMQLISGSSSVPYRAPANLGFSLGPTRQKNLLQIGDGEIFILSAEDTKAASAHVATTDAFHVYQLVVDTAQGTVEVFYDGVSTLKGSTFVDPNLTPNYISFGEASEFGAGTSDWAYVTHNAYVCP